MNLELIHLLLPLIQSLLSAVLLVIVLRGHSQNSLHRLFSLYLLGTGIWGAVIFAMRASPDIEHAYFWDRWIIPLAGFASVVLYHFAARYTDTKIRMWFIRLLYFLCFLLIPLAGTNLVLSGMQIKPYGYAPIFGPAVIPWMLFSYAVFLMALVIFVRRYRLSPNVELRNRLTYIIVGMVFSLVGSVFDALPLAGLPLYPGLILGNIAFLLLTTVAIARHNLLDIRVVFRKSTAYFFTSVVIAIPFLTIFFVSTAFLAERHFSTVAYLILIIVLAVVLPQLWRAVQQQVDRWFYRDRYDYLKALETFSQQSQSLTGLDKLGSTMINLLAGALRASSVYLLEPSSPSSDFTIVAFSARRNPACDITLRKRSLLIKWLERSQAMLFYDDIDTVPQLQAITARESEALERLGAKLIMPLKTPHGCLSGLLIFGEKLSGQHYTVEDQELIYTLSTHMAVNLENMWLYSASQHEIAERKRVEEVLRESEEFSSSLLSGAPNPIFVSNPDTTIQYVNPALEKLTGFSSVEIIDRRSPYPWWLEEEQHQYSKDLEEGMGKVTHRLERLFQRKNGEQFWVEITSTPVWRNGEYKYQLTNWVDITEHRKSEEREKKLQQELHLSSRLASIGQLAAGVAHEINNPLTGIMGFSERLLRKVTDDKSKRYLQRIYDEACRAAKVVENLRTFARHREPKKEWINVNDILQKALEMRIYELKTSNIEVVTDLAPELPQTMADFYQIQQVFLNIIINAEQAMTEENWGGRLSIRTEKKEGYIRITFTDDGPGISNEHQDRLFDPFFTTRGAQGGTGLGLSICHGIVTAHGGRIYAESSPGKGTTFVVELPVATKGKGNDVVGKRQSVRKGK